MSERDVAASLERLQAIEESVRRVLGEKRWWMTPEEFLANVEAHRRAHDKKTNSQPYDHSKCKVVVYELRRHVTYSRQLELKRLEVPV